jgi:hypothetical protein
MSAASKSSTSVGHAQPQAAEIYSSRRWHYAFRMIRRPTRRIATDVESQTRSADSSFSQTDSRSSFVAASTVPTSATGLSQTSTPNSPQPYYSQGVFLMPHIPIDQALKQRFEEEIKPRLRNELNNECGTAQFHMAFMTAGLRADWPSPAIVTWFEQARNRVAALGYKRDSPWLRDFLQNNSVQFFALRGLPHYSAAPPNSICSEVVYSEECTVIISGHANSLCGSRVIINGPQGDRECIFGGMLMVGGKPYGTTARHVFDN